MSNQAWHKYRQRWADAGNPLTGWEYVDIEDMQPEREVCSFCPKLLRYVHIIKHFEQNLTERVGCICCGRLTGDEEGAKKRQDSKKHQNIRKSNFLKNGWCETETSDGLLWTLSARKAECKIFMHAVGNYTAKICPKNLEKNVPLITIDNDTYCVFLKEMQDQVFEKYDMLK